MTQQVQGQQAEPSGKALANATLAGGLATVAPGDMTSQSVSGMASELASTADGEREASGSGWAIDLQETLDLTAHLSPRRQPTLPIRPAVAPPTGDESPEPTLGRRPLAITLLCCLLLLFAIGALDGMQQYARIHAQVDDARSHLQAAASLLRSRQPGQPLDPVTLAQLSAQLTAAQTDFDELQAELGSPSGVVLLGAFVPRLSSRIATAVDLARGGDEALQGAQALIAASNDILQMRADGYLDADGAVTRLGQLSPAATLLFLHLHAILAGAAGSLDAADVAIQPAELALLPSALIGSPSLATLDTQIASWPQTRAHLRAPDGWRLLLPFVLGAPAPASR